MYVFSADKSAGFDWSSPISVLPLAVVVDVDVDVDVPPVAVSAAAAAAVAFLALSASWLSAVVVETWFGCVRDATLTALVAFTTGSAPAARPRPWLVFSATATGTYSAVVFVTVVVPFPDAFGTAVFVVCTTGVTSASRSVSSDLATAAPLEKLTRFLGSA